MQRYEWNEVERGSGGVKMAGAQAQRSALYTVNMSTHEYRLITHLETSKALRELLNKLMHCGLYRFISL